MAFFKALGSITSLLIIVFLGYWLARKGWFSPETRKMIPRLITNVALPPYLAATIIVVFPKDHGSLFIAVGIPMLIIGSMFVFAAILAKILKVKKDHFGLFCSSISNTNTIFIGIPVNLALFGKESLAYVIFYYFAGMVFFWTIGNYFISRDESVDQSVRVPTGIQWNRIISPPIIGFCIGISLLYFNAPVPDFLLRTAEMIGQLVTPLALLFIGMTLESTGLETLRPDRDIFIAMTGRLLLAPAFAMTIMPFFHLPKLMADVYIIQSALPAILQIPILSAYYNTNPRFGAVIVTITTIGCAFTIPVWMLFL